MLQNPLAVLDAASLEDRHVVPADYAGNDASRGTSGKALLSMLLESKEHRWLYWPRMGVDEALVFKQTDTREGVAKHAAHTSFDDPTAPPNAPGRRSIELRVLVGIPRAAGGGGGGAVAAAAAPAKL